MITGDPKKGRPLSFNGNETEVFKVLKDFKVIKVIKLFRSRRALSLHTKKISRT